MDEEDQRLVKLNAEHWRREAAERAELPARLGVDLTAAGERLRRYQAENDRKLNRALNTLARMRREGIGAADDLEPEPEPEPEPAPVPVETIETIETIEAVEAVSDLEDGPGCEADIEVSPEPVGDGPGHDDRPTDGVASSDGFDRPAVVDPEQLAPAGPAGPAGEASARNEPSRLADGSGRVGIADSDGDRTRTALSSTKGFSGLSANLREGSIAMTIAALLVLVGIGAGPFAAIGVLGLNPPVVRADDPAVRPDRSPRELRPGDPHAHGLTDRDLDDLRAILRGAVDDHVAPGISLLVAHRGEVIFKEAYGDLKVDQKVQMASSAKSVTATLLLILVDQGKLALDDPVEKYLPEFKGIVLQGKPPSRPPTVRQLLSNTSGLPGDLLTESILRRLRARAGPARPADEKAVGAEVADAIEQNGAEVKKARAQFFDRGNSSLAESVRRLARGGLATEPGSGFHYCTMGFNAAARVAEVAGGRPFEELVRDELLVPLGMNDTRYVPLGPQALRPGPRLPNSESRFIIAGGGMTSTLDDFAAFYQMHANSGTYRGRRILSERSAAEMRTRQGRLDLMMAGPYGNHYGLAFFLDRLGDDGRGHVVTHPGFFGTNPWLDRDRELVGVLFVQSNFLKVIPTVRRLREKLDAVIPAARGR